MSDTALTDTQSEQPVITSRSNKYIPERDRERMRLYMADQRKAAKAGFTGPKRVQEYRASLKTT